MENSIHLYTFLLDYLGGTYVSQVYAESQNHAMRQWIAELDVKEIKGFTKSDKQHIIVNAFKDEAPVLLNRMHNIWCVTVRTKKGFGVVHFVKTARENNF